MKTQAFKRDPHTTRGFNFQAMHFQEGSKQISFNRIPMEGNNFTQPTSHSTTMQRDKQNLHPFSYTNDVNSKSYYPSRCDQGFQGFTQ